VTTARNDIFLGLIVYRPNFNDSRVKTTATRALNFVELYTKSNDICWITVSQLYKYFGNTHRPLGRWLADKLLVVRDPYYNGLTGQCKKYSKNVTGVFELKQLLNCPDFKPTIDAELDQQLITGDIIYEEKSNRSFSPLQYIPRVIRNDILANRGYRYHYDIKAAAPRLLYQRAQHLQSNLKLHHLEEFINNRTDIRQQIAKECEITENQAKTVINALLQGGVISSWTSNKIFQDLNYNYDAIIKLKNNTTVMCLKQDIKSLWVALREELPVRYMQDKSGKTRKSRVSGSDKSELYRRLENEVGVVIRGLLKKQRVNALWIHDGWSCDKLIDPSVIVTEVRRKTGYLIELDWTIYEG
jgi:hypothetical protein